MVALMTVTIMTCLKRTTASPDTLYSEATSSLLVMANTTSSSWPAASKNALAASDV